MSCRRVPPSTLLLLPLPPLLLLPLLLGGLGSGRLSGGSRLLLHVQALHDTK